MKIGVVGLGRMGYAISHRLNENGFDVIGWDRSDKARAAASGRGIRVADSARTVATDAEMVISIITEDSGVRGLFRGKDGLLAADIKGRLFIEMSTCQPMTSRALAPEVEAKGARIIDAPVLGSIPTVREGKLFVLAGGRAEDIERARAVLDKLARRVMHLGPIGAGCAMKLAVNLGLAGYIQALAESLALGQQQGLTLDQMLEVLREAPTANAWLNGKIGLLKGEEAPITIDIQTLRKDVMSAVATGTLSGVGMPLSAGTLASLSAAVAHGWGAGDIGELPRFFREFMVQRYE
jgi:3-hydroxyisobutyrate dehydrogenase-like beta-hydroxyacid dehydrogenase